MHTSAFFIFLVKCFRLFSNAVTIQVCGGTSVITPDPEFIQKLAKVQTTDLGEKLEDPDDSIDEEMEIVCSVTMKNESG